MSTKSNPASAAATTTQAGPPASSADPIFFGPFEVTSQVFLTTAHSFALVNLKPLLPGHVLVCPRRPHRRLTDLRAEELTDLLLAVQRVQRMLARHYFEQPENLEDGGSFNIAIQDGREAGQTVAHVHVHVIPRIRGATAKDEASGAGDAVYEQMAGEEGNVGGALWDRRLREQQQQQKQHQHQHQDVEGGEEGKKKTEERRDDGEGRWEVHAQRPRPGGGFARIEDAERRPRSMREMEAEAAVFRAVLRDMLSEGDGEAAR